MVLHFGSGKKRGPLPIFGRKALQSFFGLLYLEFTSRRFYENSKIFVPHRHVIWSTIIKRRVLRNSIRILFLSRQQLRLKAISSEKSGKVPKSSSNSLQNVLCSLFSSTVLLRSAKSLKDFEGNCEYTEAISCDASSTWLCCTDPRDILWWCVKCSSFFRIDT